MLLKSSSCGFDPKCVSMIVLCCFLKGPASQHSSTTFTHAGADALGPPQTITKGPCSLFNKSRSCSGYYYRSKWVKNVSWPIVWFKLTS